MDDTESVHNCPTFHCPFPQCAQSRERGAGWLTPLQLFLHVNSIHLSCGQLPTTAFLQHYRREVCLGCTTLKTVDKPCPGCQNRDRKTLRRWVRQPHSIQEEIPQAAAPRPTDLDPEVAPFATEGAYLTHDFDETLPSLEEIFFGPTLSSNFLFLWYHLLPSFLAISCLTTKALACKGLPTWHFLVGSWMLKFRRLFVILFDVLGVLQLHLASGHLTQSSEVVPTLHREQYWLLPLGRALAGLP